MVQIHAEHAPVGRAPVGSQQQGIAGEIGIPLIVVLQDGRERAGMRQVLHVNLAALAGDAFTGCDQEPPPVIRQAHADVSRGPVAFAKDLLVRPRTCAHGVIPDARTLAGGEAGIVESRFVGFDGDAKVAGARENVWKLPASGDIQQVDLAFIFAAAAEPVCHQAAVVSDPRELHRRGGIVGDFRGIDQDFVRPFDTVTDTQRVTVFGSHAAAEEIAAPARDRRTHAVDLKQRAQFLAQLVAARNVVEKGARVMVLRGQPFACSRRVLILQPAVGVGDGDAVHDFGDRIGFGKRRSDAGREQHGGGHGKQRCNGDTAHV